MSAHYSNYTNIDGNTAFLAGAVSTYADAYLCEILPKYWGIVCALYHLDFNNSEYDPLKDENIIKQLNKLGIEL